MLFQTLSKCYMVKHYVNKSTEMSSKEQASKSTLWCEETTYVSGKYRQCCFPQNTVEDLSCKSSDT